VSTPMLYVSKSIDMEICIICIDGDFSKIRKTQKSACFLTKDYKVLGVIPENREPEPIDTKIYKGKNCVTSLIDVAIKNVQSDWAFIVFAGSVIKKKIDHKLSHYIENENDVLFPVVNRIYDFIRGSMNGILINKSFYAKVGEFGSGNNLQDTKILWADRALQNGVKFKAIVGACNI
jgi:hypothetical protein